MADGVAISAGTGTTILTDDTGASGHAQVFKLAIATDGSATLVPADATLGVRVHEATVATATLSNVAGSATSVTLDASNAARRGLFIHNDSTAILYVKYGATASTTSYSVRLDPGVHWEMPAPIFTGVIDGIWSAAAGNARVTELTV